MAMASASMVTTCEFLARGAPGRARLTALCIRLRDVGGASAARALTHALDRLLLKLQQDDDASWSRSTRHRREEGDAAVGAGAGAGAGAANDEPRRRPAEDDGAAAAAAAAAFGDVAGTAKVVLDVAWEKLHTGDWKDVDVAWRELYVLGAMLRVSAAAAAATAAAESNRGAAGDEAAGSGAGAGATGADTMMTPAEALRALDMAALLGGPAFRDELEDAVERAQAAATAAATATRRELDDGADDDGEGDGDREADKGRPSWRLGGDEDGDESGNGDGDGDGNDGDPGGFVSSPLPPGSLSSGAPSLRAPVPRLDIPPSLESFYCNHMIAGEGGCGVPVVISGAMSHWPALRRRGRPRPLFTPLLYHSAHDCLIKEYPVHN